MSRLTALLGIDLPVLQAPMAGAGTVALAAAVGRAGGLGSLPCALLGLDDVRRQVAEVRALVDAPVHLNFFCHSEPVADQVRLARWEQRLARFHAELGTAAVAGGPGRQPFDGAACALVEELRPQVVSFHFGLPEPALVDRVRAAGAVVLASATTVAEARWLEANGADVVIAQGLEAGGHRGMFLTDDPATQVGTLALVPRVVDAVGLPVVAAGGVADGRGVAAVLVLGAQAAQVGTAYLRTPEVALAPLHRAALEASEDDTVLTDVFTGRPARSVANRATRELGPLAAEAPPFPLGVGALAPLRAAAEAAGSSDFTPLWAGQAASLATDIGAETVTRALAAGAAAALAVARDP